METVFATTFSIFAQRSAPIHSKSKKPYTAQLQIDCHLTDEQSHLLDMTTLHDTCCRFTRLTIVSTLCQLTNLVHKSKHVHMTLHIPEWHLAFLATFRPKAVELPQEIG